jgi:hypothetical protein
MNMFSDTGAADMPTTPATRTVRPSVDCPAAAADDSEYPACFRPHCRRNSSSCYETKKKTSFGRFPRPEDVFVLSRLGIAC